MNIIDPTVPNETLSESKFTLFDYNCCYRLAKCEREPWTNVYVDTLFESPAHFVSFTLYFLHILVEAMKTADLIKCKRENLHIKNRLKQGKQLRKKRDLNNLEKNISLIRSPAGTIQSVQRR